MAASTCAKCDSTSFEVVSAEPRHANYKIWFIQCSSCGTVIGTAEYYQAGELLQEQKSALASVKKQLTEIESDVSRIKDDVSTIKRAVK